MASQVINSPVLLKGDAMFGVEVGGRRVDVQVGLTFSFFAITTLFVMKSRSFCVVIFIAKQKAT